MEIRVPVRQLHLEQLETNPHLSDFGASLAAMPQQCLFSALRTSNIQ